MSRRQSGGRATSRLPSDFPEPRKPAARQPDLGLSGDALHVQPMTEQRLWDARMAVTCIQRRAERCGGVYGQLGPIAEVWRALGIAEPLRTSRLDATSVACPTCPAVAGAGCLHVRYGSPLQAPHAKRFTAARKAMV